jgi:transposase InsO family protein
VRPPGERYDRKTALTAVDLLDDRVVPFFDEQGIGIDPVATDRGSEFRGVHHRRDRELYVAVENIDHSRTKTKSPPTNGICERFHETRLDEVYRVAFRKCVYQSLEVLRAHLDAWMASGNEVGPQPVVGTLERLRRRRWPSPVSCTGESSRCRGAS